MEDHLRKLIDDIGLDTLFEQLDLDPADVIAHLIAEGRAELPPGLEPNEDEDGEEL